MSTNNILSPANFDPIIVPSQDVVLGLYFMTRERIGARGEGMQFANREEVHRAFENRVVDLNASITVRLTETLLDNPRSLAKILNILHFSLAKTTKITRVKTTVLCCLKFCPPASPLT